MMATKSVKIVGTALLVWGLVTGGMTKLAARPPADDVALRAETFDLLRKQIRPQPGESRWMEIPWLTDLHEARKKAAAEGKPIFLASGGGATGIGAC